VCSAACVIQCAVLVKIFKQLHSTGETSKESIKKFNRKLISLSTAPRQFIAVHVQAMLVGETLKAKTRAEKANNLKTVAQ